MSDHVFEWVFAFKVAETANITQISQQCHNKCSKCRPFAFTQACRWFLKFAINLQIAFCGKLFQVFISIDFSSGTSFGCRFKWCNFSCIDPKHYSQADWHLGYCLSRNFEKILQHPKPILCTVWILILSLTDNLLVVNRAKIQTINCIHRINRICLHKKQNHITMMSLQSGTRFLAFANEILTDNSGIFA